MLCSAAFNRLLSGGPEGPHYTVSREQIDTRSPSVRDSRPSAVVGAAGSAEPRRRRRPAVPGTLL